MSYSQGLTRTDYVLLSICESVCEGDAMEGSACATLVGLSSVAQVDPAVGKLLTGQVDSEVTYP